MTEPLELVNSMATLELYMMHSMGTKLRLAYRTELYSERDERELIILLLYVLVHCSRRSEFIPNIMAM